MDLRIDIIDTFDGFKRVKDRWRTLYEADPNANMFLQWAWLCDWFEVTPYDWRVLAARPTQSNGDADAYIAFFPIAEYVLRRCGIGIQNYVYLGGKPLADYTGFVCDPAHEHAAVKAFARHLKERTRWDRFRVLHMMDDRSELFFGEFDDPDLAVSIEDEVPCPRVELPETFDAYLQTYMSNKSRYNLRRGIRQCESVAEFRSTRTDMSTIDEHLYAVLHMWQRRWGQLSKRDEERYHWMYRLALDDGRLWMHLLWDGDTPMAGLIGFVDSIKQTFSYHISGFNPDYERLSPGKAIVGYSIRHAIENKYRIYDFLLGGESYKTEYFGAVPRYAKSMTVDRRGFMPRVRRKVASWVLPARPASAPIKD